ncbi:hypothetical protein D1007_16067 [Hordeum vulgare]|uniref:Uncharacterized protein n=1 Tax=Hordeum vulgare subsp. vulgare TaxID=112509 RepID=A0A8I6WJ89_HORVV|nr:uncharacterized protein LOC123402510 [Hordeum vulgare subsp. vulgare]KAE8807533.1 hypothetical protein D1007_16067 [Hordeum vulgare]KAI5020451.1 hypothetical protein ZWY2020_045339 [Hordeum vulgare]
MEGERKERKGEEEVAAVFRRGWDCGSQLYDSVELAFVYRVLDNHLMASPSAQEPAVQGRSRSRTSAPAAKAKNGSRRRAVARRTGKAVLHSIFRSVTCSRKLS